MITHLLLLNFVISATLITLVTAIGIKLFEVNYSEH